MPVLWPLVLPGAGYAPSDIRTGCYETLALHNCLIGLVQLLVQYCLKWSAHPFLTALRLNEELGSVTIIHPFHPMSGKELQILKTRKIAGKIFLVLHNEQIGNFNIPADWTDYFPVNHDASIYPGAFISVESLLALCKIVKKSINNA